MYKIDWHHIANRTSAPEGFMSLIKYDYSHYTLTTHRLLDEVKVFIFVVKVLLELDHVVRLVDHNEEV